MFEDLKSISYGVLAFGSKKGMLDPSSVNAFTTAISGLNAEQAVLALTTRGLTETQQKQVLLNAGLIASSDHISGSLIQQALANEGLDKEKQDDILINLGLMDSQTKELIATRAVTEELLRQQLINQGYQGEKLESMVASAMQTKQNGLEAMSWEVLGTKIKKASLAMLKNPLTWVVVGIAAIASLVKGYDALIGKHEKLAKQDLEKIGADLQEVEEEIASLETLQDKLIDAKGNKSELAKISEELNSVIGETKGLLNGESKAWDIANTKIEANIALLKEQKKQLQQDKVDKSRVVYDNNVFERDWNIDIDGETMRDYVAKYNENLSKWNSLSPSSKEIYGTAEHYAFLTMQTNKGGEAYGIDEVEWAKYWEEQVDYAYDVFADTVDSYEGVGGQGIVKQLISDMVWSGADLDEINDALFAFIDNSDIQGAINTYWESFTNPDINTEEALKNVRTLFDSIIKKYPELKGFFNDYYNQIMVGGNSVADNTVKNVDKMTTSLEDLKNTSEGISSLSKAFKELSDDGYITIETISNIKEAAGLSDEVWDEYYDKLLTVEQGSEEFNEILKDLTYQILENKFKTEGLANATEEEVAAVLRENGVLNANEVAHDAVNKAKAEQRVQNINLAEATSVLSEKLNNEATATSMVKSAFVDLVAQEKIFSNSTLNVKGKIDALKSLWSAAFMSNSAIVSLIDNIKEGVDVEQGRYSPWGLGGFGGTLKPYYEYNGKKYYLGTEEYNNLPSLIWADLMSNVDSSDPYTTPQYSTGNNSGNGDGDDDDPDYWDSYDEILEDNQKKREAYEDSIEVIKYNLEKAIESGDIEEIKRLYKEIDSLYDDAISDILPNQQAEEKRILTDEILPRIWELIPSLDGKDWDSVTEVEKEKILEGMEDGYTKDEVSSLFDVADSFTEDISDIADTIQDYGDENEDKLEEAIEGILDVYDNRNEESANAFEDAIRDRDIEAVNKYFGILKTNSEEIRAYINGLLESDSLPPTVREMLLETLGELDDEDVDNYESWFNTHKDEYQRTDEEFAREFEKAIESGDVGLAKSIAEKRMANQESLQEWLTSIYNDENTPIHIKNDIQAYINESEDVIDDTLNGVNDAINNCFSEYKRHIDRTTSELQKQADAYDILINKGQALVDGQQKMYDAQANIRQIQRDITKELRTNKAMAEYLDESTRKLLFNEDDYKKLNKKLNLLSTDIASLNSWYKNKINSLTEEEWYLEESITKEYERRLAMKEKEYEIARAELDLEKKKQELNNILNERNIRMLVRGDDGSYSWQYVHNVEEASRVVGEISDLESEISDSRLQAMQQSILNNKQADVDNLSAEKASIENFITMMNEEAEQMSIAIENIVDPLEDFGVVMQRLVSVIYGGNSNTEQKVYDATIDYSEAIAQAVAEGNYEAAAEYERKRNAKIDSEGLDYEKTYEYHKKEVKAAEKTAEQFDVTADTIKNDTGIVSDSASNVTNSFDKASKSVGNFSDTLTAFSVGSAKRSSSEDDDRDPVTGRSSKTSNKNKNDPNGLKRIEKRLREIEYSGQGETSEYSSLRGQYRRRANRLGIADYEPLNPVQIVTDVSDGRAGINVKDFESKVVEKDGKKYRTTFAGHLVEVKDNKKDEPFDNGGIASGKGYLFKDVDADELVLDPKQTDIFSQYVGQMENWESTLDNLSKIIYPPMPVSKADTAKNESFNFYGNLEFPNVQNADDFIREFTSRVKSKIYKHK